MVRFEVNRLRRHANRFLILGCCLCVCPASHAGPDISSPGTGRVVQKSLGVELDFGPDGATVRAVGPPGPTRVSLWRVGDPFVQPYNLVVGDVVTHINSRKIESVDDYVRALDLGHRQAVLRIVDAITGRVSDWTCEPFPTQESLKFSPSFLAQGGVRVGFIDPASPFRRLVRLGDPSGQLWTLEEGHVITEVNGEPIDGVATYTRALNRSFGSAVLTVPNRTTGEPLQYVAGPIPSPVRAPAATGQRNEPPTVENLSSGRSNIRFARFHAILVFDSEQHGKTADNDRFLLNSVFSIFELEFVRDSSTGPFKIPDDFRIVSDFVVVDPVGLSPAKLRDAIAKVGERVQPGDVVFLWVETEGRIQDGRRILQLGALREEMDRDELLESIQFKDADGARRTRLSILITDACSVGPAIAFAPAGYDSGVATTVWKSLYFGHEGVVDISSSRADQKAIAPDGAESVFARAFRDLLDTGKFPKDRIDRPSVLGNGAILKDGFIDWTREFFPLLRDVCMQRGGGQEPVLLPGTNVRPVPFP